MARWLKRAGFALAIAIVCTAMAGAVYQALAERADLARHPPPGRLVDVGGHRLHIWCTGAGTPAVVLDSGLGGSFVDWSYVQPEVARFTTACTYDRAGMGYSDAGPFPRTSERIADELARLLDHSGLAGPVVLVGASLGGFNMRIFASTRPQRTAGLVLVDASHETQRPERPALARFVGVLSTLGVFRSLGISFGQPPHSVAPHVRDAAALLPFRTSAYQAAASELLTLETSQAQLKASRRKLEIPVIVLTAGRNKDPEWQRMQRDQTTLSDIGCQMIAAGASHVIPLSRPAIVVGAIKSMVEATRKREATDLCLTSHP